MRGCKVSKTWFNNSIPEIDSVNKKPTKENPQMLNPKWKENILGGKIPEGKRDPLPLKGKEGNTGEPDWCKADMSARQLPRTWFRETIK